MNDASGHSNTFKPLHAPDAHGRGSGRPDGARDVVPRGELTPRIAALLAARPYVTAAGASERLGIHPGTAQRVLRSVRMQAVAAALLAEAPATSADDIAVPRAGVCRREAGWSCENFRRC
ncbi:hypothetical protein [Streptomyces sp. SAS_272]|uniref:hypothetical protein n=1 Tax=Streptomyces sp. SAS_272 TaxID=3412747 RepID=UPI00403D0FE6